MDVPPRLILFLLWLLPLAIFGQFRTSDTILPSELAALGEWGPLGPHGPLSKKGPIGNVSIPTSFNFDELAAFSGLLAFGGPLSAWGPLGGAGPLGAALAFFPPGYQPGERLGILGPVGPLGAAGPLGPLGTMGAHQLSRDPKGLFRDADGNRVTEVKVPYGLGRTREFPLHEHLSAGHARNRENDSSFMTSDTVDAGSALEYRFRVAYSEWVSILLIPDVMPSTLTIALRSPEGNRVFASSHEKVPWLQGKIVTAGVWAITVKERANKQESFRLVVSSFELRSWP